MASAHSAPGGRLFEGTLEWKTLVRLKEDGEAGLPQQQQACRGAFCPARSNAAFPHGCLVLRAWFHVSKLSVRAADAPTADKDSASALPPQPGLGQPLAGVSSALAKK